MIDKLLELNLMPDSLIRFGIRRLLKQRLSEENKGSDEANQEALMQLIKKLKNSPIAVNTMEANEQHYEIPEEFYINSLGKNLKYSCAYWNSSTSNLDEAEEKMLSLTVDRAGIKDGETILELGCGWGSLTLYMAKKFPQSSITAVSNSASQKAFIDKIARERELNNINIITRDINSFELDKQFDRIVSVEMFEHIRNYEKLFNKVHSLLKPGGEIFIHIFTHNRYSYLFEVKNNTDWMSKYFFTGGIMPGDNLFFYFTNKFEVKNHWIVNGTHYQKTAEEWLKNMDKNKSKIYPLFGEIYGKENAQKWFVYWRVFFMSCAELWGFDNGNEWHVSHYLFRKVDL